MKILVSLETRVRADSTGVYFIKAFKDLGHEVDHVLPENMKDVKGGYDLYVKVDDGLRFSWPKDLHPSHFYCIDTHIETDWRIEAAKNFDSVSVVHKTGLGLGFHVKPTWIPVACDPDLHYVGQKEKIFDVCFIGNFHSQFAGRRIDMVHELFRESPNFFFGTRTFKDMAEKYAQSKIVFNCHLSDDESANMRTFEALCSGSCLVSNRMPGMMDLGFEDGKHYVGYDTKEEMIEVVRSLLKDDERRERIAKEGRLEVLRNHTYQHRARAILDSIKDSIKLHTQERELCKS